VSAALLAAVSTNPAMLAPVQEQFRKWQEWIREDGLDLVNGAIVRLAAEGLWLADLFGLAELEPDLRRRVLERLRELTRQQGGAATEDAETGLVVDRAGGGAGGGAGEPGPGGA